MADKIINVRGYKFELLRWNEKWVFPFITYYQSGLGSPVCIVLFSWNQEEDIFEQETTVTVNLPHYERGAGCQFVDTNNNGSSMTDWLVNNGFEICRELIAEDAGVLYQVITARFGGETRLTDGELFTGKYELAEDNTLYVRLLREQHRRFDKAVHEMSSGDKCPKYKLRLFEELLGQLTEMRDRYDADK